MSKHGQQIIEAAAGKVDEEILAAAFAKPRGSTTFAAGPDPISREIGARWAGRQTEGAAAAGVELGNPGAVAVTPTSLLTLAVKVGFTGQIKDVTDVLSRIALTDVESLEVKRMGLAGVMSISTAAGSFKVEGKAGDMKELAAAFERARSSA